MSECLLRSAKSASKLGHEAAPCRASHCVLRDDGAANVTVFVAAHKIVISLTLILSMCTILFLSTYLSY